MTFELDANGILKVSAGDKGSGKMESITITNDKGRLSAEEIERMVEEAEKYAEEDKATRERIESRNGLENYAYSLKNQLNDDDGLGRYCSTSDCCCCRRCRRLIHQHIWPLLRLTFATRSSCHSRLFCL